MQLAQLQGLESVISCNLWGIFGKKFFERYAPNVGGASLGSK